MAEREYKSPFALRGAHLNCPLPMAMEAYWSCEADCFHCLGRKLNQIWGEDQRVVRPEKITKMLTNSQRNPRPLTPLAKALSARKTIWIGRKADPYQPIEKEKMVVRRILESLIELDWSFVICTKYPHIALRDTDLFRRAGKLATILVEITPGGEDDWVLFERERTTPVEKRLRIASRWQRLGINVGVRGEPFIPGYHTSNQFRAMVRRILSHGLRSYNTYNLHLNDYTAKRLHEIGLDIERIWTYNQELRWRPIQRDLCKIAEEEGIVLGCPDFVNVPTNWQTKSNTCCGVSVPNPFTYNSHYWRQLIQDGCKNPLDETWEGIGTAEDQEEAKIIAHGKSKIRYTMKDAGLR